MRIWWQSFLDPAISADYIARLAQELARIATPGTEITVHGLTPPDRDFGRLSEFRCAILAVDNGLEAAAQGYDAVVLGHFQDPGLMELKSALPIPVVGAGEASLHLASQIGRRIGLVTLDRAFEVWHLEQAELYGLGARVIQCSGLNADPSDFAPAFAGDAAAKARMIAAFRTVAEPMVARGADVIVPAGVLPGLLIGGEHGFRVAGAPVVNCAAAALMQAETLVRMHRLYGLEPAGGAFCTRAPARAVADFRALVAKGRTP